MRPESRIAPWRIVLAIVLAASAVTYSVLWMISIRWESTAMLGIDYHYSPFDHSLTVTEVYPGTPAARAGLREGDRIVGIDQQPMQSLDLLMREVNAAQPGDVVELMVERPPTAETLVLSAELAAWPRTSLTRLQRLALELVFSFPVLFLAVAVPVLFLRLHDRHAWLLALMFFSFIAGAPIQDIECRIPSALRGFAWAYHLIAGAPSGAILYFFFAVFPKPSPLDRRVPWLKWVLPIPLGSLGLGLGLWCLVEGNGNPLRIFGHFIEHRAPWIDMLITALSFGAYVLGFVSLIANTGWASDVQVRRKTRVLAWGTLVALAPMLILQLVAMHRHVWFYELPFWIWTPCVLLLFVLPASFAYAVVKQRVLEVPVLLRRSARYLLVQRGFTGLLILISVGILVSAASLLEAYWAGDAKRAYGPEVGIGTGLGAGLLAVLLFWGGGRVRNRVTERLDRAFFRSSYDARQILEQLAEKSRSALDRDELVGLLDRQLRAALHPASLQIFLRGDGNALVARTGSQDPPPKVAVDHPRLIELAQRGRPWDLGAEPEAGERGDLALHGECLVPVVDRRGRLLGVLSLGPRLSEETYSGEDKRLLSSVASQAALALESFDLAEEIAARAAAERRAAHEMEIARQVQSHLFPQKSVTLDTLEYTARCIQARAVGGDYYDFLDLGDGRLGLVLADISGKGISGALLMANLQANLRSRTALARRDLSGMLHAVNDAMVESTEISQFATLFFGIYDDGSRTLRYVNCGHNPPLVVRTTGEIERLLPTATVLGAFPEWDDGVEQVRIEADDLLVLYSDGATEARDEGGDQFGEERLTSVVRRHRDREAGAVADELVSAVQEFNGGRREDDLTLVVARGVR